jgi:hypothetical protein
MKHIKERSEFLTEAWGYNELLAIHFETDLKNKKNLKKHTVKKLVQ